MIDQVQTTRFPNGLTIMTEHMPGLRSVSLGIWVRRGSRHEAAALNGIHHFIEHALFKGTQRRSAHQIASESDRLGGHLDAYTAHEITGFAIKMVDTALVPAFVLLSDLISLAARAANRPARSADSKLSRTADRKPAPAPYRPS